MRISKERLRYGLASGILMTAAGVSFVLSTVGAEPPSSGPTSVPPANCITEGEISRVSVGDPTAFSTTADAARVAFLQDLYPQVPTVGWLVESETSTRVVFSLFVGSVKQAYVETLYMDGFGWYGSDGSVCANIIGPIENITIVPTTRTWDDDTN